MNEETIVSGMTGRYASALHSLASERSQTDSVRAALNNFRQMLDASEDLRRLVRNPMFSAPTRSRRSTPLLAKAGVAGLAADFIKLLANKRRLFAVGDMIEGFNKLDDAGKGVTRAQVTVRRAAVRRADRRLAGGAAAPRPAAGASRSTQRSIPSIIGGLVVKLGSRMMDGSLRTKLASIRTRMKEVG